MEGALTLALDNCVEIYSMICCITGANLSPAVPSHGVDGHA